MKCYLHIGTEKTGTTLLQEWLYDNEDALAENGIKLSRVLSVPNNRNLVAYHQDYIDDWLRPRGIQNVEQKKEFYEKNNLIENFRNEVAESEKTHKTFIITSEHFHSRLISRKNILELKSFLYSVFDSVEVICYFREQASMRQSLYSTALKSAFTTAFENFKADIDANDYYFNFNQIAIKWSEAFGKENCHFKVFDKASFIDGDIRKDFITIIDPELSLNVLNYDTNIANSSLSYVQAELFRAINKYLPYYDKVTGRVNESNVELKNIIESSDLLRIGSLGSNINLKIFNRFKGSNRKLSNSFFNGQDLFKEPKDIDDTEINMSLKEVSELLSDFLGLLIKSFGDKVLLPSDIKKISEIVNKNTLELLPEEKVFLENIVNKYQSLDKN